MTPTRKPRGLERGVESDRGGVGGSGKLSSTVTSGPIRPCRLSHTPRKADTALEALVPARICEVAQLGVRIRSRLQRSASGFGRFPTIRGVPVELLADDAQQRRGRVVDRLGVGRALVRSHVYASRRSACQRAVMSIEALTTPRSDPDRRGGAESRRAPSRSRPRAAIVKSPPGFSFVSAASDLRDEVGREVIGRERRARDADQRLAGSWKRSFAWRCIHDRAGQVVTMTAT